MNFPWHRFLFAFFISVSMAAPPTFEFSSDETAPDTRVLSLNWDPGYGMILERSQDLTNWEKVDWHYTFGETVAYELFRVIDENEPPPAVDPNALPVHSSTFLYRSLPNGLGLVVSWPRQGADPARVVLPELSLPEGGVTHPVCGKNWDSATATWNFTMVYQGEIAVAPPSSTDLNDHEMAMLASFRSVWPLIRADFENAQAQAENRRPLEPAPAEDSYYWRVTRVVLDSDGDGLKDHEELARDEPTNPFDEDTDNDGVLDGAEVEAGTDPNGHATITDSDGDGVPDEHDADAGDPAVSWRKVPDTDYVILKLDRPFPSSMAASLPFLGLTDLAEDGSVLASYSPEINGTHEYVDPGNFPVTKCWSISDLQWRDVSLVSGSLLAAGTKFGPDENILGAGIGGLGLESGGPGAVRTLVSKQVSAAAGNGIQAIGLRQPFVGPFSQFGDFSLAPSAPPKFASGGSSSLLLVETGLDGDGPDPSTQWHLSLQSGTFIEPILSSSFFNDNHDLGGISLAGSPSGWLAYSLDDSSAPEDKLVQVASDSHPMGPYLRIDGPGGEHPVSSVTGISKSIEWEGQGTSVIWSSASQTHVYSGGQWIESSRAEGDPLRISGAINARGEALKGANLVKNGRLIPLDELAGEASGLSGLRGIDLNDAGTILAYGVDANEGVEERPVLLHPVEVVSADRLLAGSFEIADSWADKLKVQFVHSDTGEDLGTYSNLLSKDEGAYLYDSDQHILGDADRQAWASGVLDPRIINEDVTFCLRPGEPGVVEFYTAFSSLGSIEIRFILNDETVGVVHHVLEEEQSFSQLIDYFEQLIVSNPFSPGALALAEPDEAGGAAAFQQVGLVGQNGEGLDPMTKKVLSRLANSYAAIAGGDLDIESMIFGLYDGISMGLKDDWQLLTFIGDGTVSLAEALSDQLQAEINNWASKPNRALEVAKILDSFIETVVREPLDRAARDAEIFAANFSSKENFKRFSWSLMRKAKRFAEKAPGRAKQAALLALKLRADVNKVMFEALSGWWLDFCDRMFEGAEKTVFDAENAGEYSLWKTKKREFYYTFSYAFGYMVEQAFLGKGIGAIGKGMTKVGGKVGLKALPGVKRFVLRVLPFLTKRWTQQTISTADNQAIQASLRGAQTEALESQIRTGLGYTDDATRSVADFLDEALKNQLQKLNGKILVEEIAKSPNIRTMMRNQLGRNVFLSRMAMMQKLLGDKLDDVVLANFVKLYDQRLIKDAAKGVDQMDEFLVAIHNHIPGTERLLVDVIAGNPAAIQRLESFLRPPSPFSPWKVGFGTANQWGHSSRGRLIQLFEAYHGTFKGPGWRNLDVLENGVVKHSTGLDFAKVAADGTPTGIYAEIKSTASPTPDLAKQLRNSVTALKAKQGHTLEFYIYHLASNPSPHLTSLEQLAASLATQNDVTVRVIKVASNFQHWSS